MNEIINVFLSLGFVFACLSIVSITAIIRQFVEFFLDKPWFPGSKFSVIYREILLPILPLILGIIAGVTIEKYPYPTELIGSGGRVIFWIVAGLLSGLIYKMIKGALVKQLPEEVAQKITNQMSEEDAKKLIEKVSDSIESK